MALAASEAAAETADTSNTTSYAGTNFTPSANNLLLYFVNAAGTVAVATMSGGSLTWTRQDSQLNDNGVDTLYVFTAPTGSSPASCTPTFDCTGDAATGVTMCGYTISGYNTSSPIVQIVKGSGNAANPAVTFATLNTNNAYFIGVGVNRTAPAVDPPSGSWTEICDTGHSSPGGGLQSSFRVNGETGTTYTCNAASSRYAIIGVEIAVAPTAGASMSINMLMGMG